VAGLSLSSLLCGASFAFPFQDGERATAGTGSAAPIKESGWGNMGDSSIASIVVSDGSAMGRSAGRGPSPPTRLNHTKVNTPEGKRRR